MDTTLPSTLKVLIVDDERVSRTVLSRFITKKFPFCSVIEAENGLDGLQLINKESPDIVFLDLRMPIMNGVEMLEVMRKIPNRMMTPVAITSAVQEKSIVLRLNQLGVIEYLLKPFDVTSVYPRISKVFKSLRENKENKDALEAVAPDSGTSQGQKANTHKILLVDDDLSFQMFFTSMIGNRCEVICCDNGEEAYKKVLQDRMITDVCISENLPDGNTTAQNQKVGLQNVNFLAKKLVEIERSTKVRVLLCADRESLFIEEKKYFKGLIKRTYVQKQFLESLLKKVFDDDSREGAFRHAVANRFNDKIQSALISELPSFIKENIAILDGKGGRKVENEHAEEISIKVIAGKIDISVTIEGDFEDFEKLSVLRGDTGYSHNYRQHQIFQSVLSAIATIFVDLLKQFDYKAEVDYIPRKRDLQHARRVLIFNVPFLLASGEEFDCCVWFNDFDESTREK
jgi:two-component system response regulator (stage 0 sporulation protein F)